MQHILAMAQIEDQKVDNMLTICNGVIDLKKGIDQNYKVYTLAELVKNKKAERTPAPDNAVEFYEKAETKKEGPTKTRKKAGEAKGKAATEKKPAKGTNTQAKAEKPEKQPENAKKEESKKLLNEDLNI